MRKFGGAALFALGLYFAGGFLLSLVLDIFVDGPPPHMTWALDLLSAAVLIAGCGWVARVGWRIWHTPPKAPPSPAERLARLHLRPPKGVANVGPEEGAADGGATGRNLPE